LKGEIKMNEAGRYNVEIEKWNEVGESILNTLTDWKEKRTYDSHFTKQNTLKPVYSFFQDKLKKDSIVLDYGCGHGWTTRLLAQKAGLVKCIDISDGCIRVLNKFCDENNIINIEPVVGNGETLPYNDEEFNIVYGNAVLHHIELDKCLPEISRVLKKGGMAAFCEPFAENPLINFVRFVKHHFIEKHVGTDKPLKYKDVEIFKKYFSKVTFVESSFFRNRYSFLKAFDSFLVKIPIVKRYACYIAILLEK
jgi:ubiquinone/menaquinone biosynthesis C-methylase UbiE